MENAPARAEAVRAAISDYHEDLTRIRRDIHAHPELGFEEQRTAGIVADELEKYGLEVYRGIGRTGVVGALRVGNSPRSVGLRADMDALPIVEGNTFGHKSTHHGVMHACGHDGHTVMLLGAARYLAETRDFNGQVFFIFQPAEEGLGGAQAMLDDGLFEQFPCECIFGMHNRPSLPLGEFAVRAGAMMAGGAFFDISIDGKGAHGARPETSIDPVVVGASIVTALQSIVSRCARPVDTAVVSVTQMHTGDPARCGRSLTRSWRWSSSECARYRPASRRHSVPRQRWIFARFSAPPSTTPTRPITQRGSATTSSVARMSIGPRLSSWLRRTSPSC